METLAQRGCDEREIIQFLTAKQDRLIYVTKKNSINLDQTKVQAYQEMH